MTKLRMSMASEKLRISQIRIDKTRGWHVISTPLVLLLTSMVVAPALAVQPDALTPVGIAWRAKGNWRVRGARGLIQSGDAIPPGSLLLPNGPPTPHSIVVLLPDGQRILYECFTEEQCERGFRVPSLNEKPAPFATEMLARIRAVLIRERDTPQSKPQVNRLLPREEALAALGPRRQVSIAGLAASLPDGQYTYEPIDRDAHGSSSSKRSTFVKKGPSIHLTLPSTGIYDLIIRDELSRPRIDLFIAAVEPAETPELTSSLRHARQLWEQWNEDYQGWPIDDFERAYLTSLALKIGPQRNQAREATATRAPRPDRTAEPEFSPRPGVFEKDVRVYLRCVTPGATIHYTVDTSQPVESSPVYGAPISVKKTELTVKAFASSAGKKDSAVVTGIFRIEQ